MRSQALRSGKYSVKTSGMVTGNRLAAYGKVQTAQFRMKAGRQVRIEHTVKAILEDGGVMPALNHFYMNFGKRVDRIRATHRGPVAWDEVCIEYGRWESRGLDKDILDKIVCNIMVSPCNPCPDCPPEYGLPWTGQVTTYFLGDDATYKKGYTLTRPIVKGAGSTRFTDNGDGTVTDNATGLMWVKNPAGLGPPFDATMLWEPAITACEGLTFAGHGDWRLPNVKEIFSIVDHGFNTPAADSFFFTIQGNKIYWSSTRRMTSPNSAFALSTQNGTIGSSTTTVTPCYVIPVRGGAP